MPQRVFAFKIAVAAHNVATLLDARFSECNPNMVQFCVVDFKQGALAAKDFVCYFIHSILVVVVLDIS